MKTGILALASAAALTMPVAAHAAQADYFLKIEGVEGESAVTSWSFGACNAGGCSTIASPRDAASGLASGKRQHKPAWIDSPTGNLRESPTRRHSHHSDSSAGGGAGGERTATYDLKTNKGARVAVAAGDLDGDGVADLAYAGTQNEISSFSLTFDKIEATHRRVCGGKHIAKATLRSAGDSFELIDVMVACSMAGHEGPVDMVMSGGKMKHIKSGHVTLMK